MCVSRVEDSVFRGDRLAVVLHSCCLAQVKIMNRSERLGDILYLYM